MRVGITFSSFDLLHAGHVQMLREAKSQCDYLICGLQYDPSIDRLEKNQPVQSMVERYTQLNAIKYVDEIVPYMFEHEVVDILSLYKPDVRILGDEYRHQAFTGKELCQQYNIELYFNSRRHRFSTTNLRQDIQNAKN